MPDFELRQVSEALGIKPDTIKTWGTRGYTHRISGGGGPGQRRQYSWQTVVQIAVANEAINLGVRPQLAFLAADLFAHFGKGPSTWEGGKPPKEPLRHAAAPFDPKDGRTILAISGEKKAVLFIPYGVDTFEVVRRFIPNRPGAVLIDLNQVFASTCKAFGFEPAKVLAASQKSIPTNSAASEAAKSDATASGEDA